MIGILKKTYDEFVEDDCFSEAAALAYFSILALPPLLVVAVSVAGFFLDPQDVNGHLEGQICSLVGAQGAQQIKEMLAHANQPGRGLRGTILGFGVLLLGASGVMAHLQRALNKVWHVEPDPEGGEVKSFLLKRVVSFGMVLGIGFLLIVSLVVSSVTAAAGSAFASYLPGGSKLVMAAIDIGVSLLVFTLLFAGMFKWMPDADISWRNVWTGAFLTSCLFILGKFLIGAYLGSQDFGSTYGAAGSLVLLLVWFYYSGLILFMGAELTQVLALRRGAGILPSVGAVKVLRHTEIVKRDECDERVYRDVA